MSSPEFVSEKAPIADNDTTALEKRDVSSSLEHDSEDQTRRADIDAAEEQQCIDLIVQNQLLSKSGERRTTTFKEIIAYYLWYAGAGGLAPVSYGAVQCQNLMFYAGHDPIDPTGLTPCSTGGCVLNFAGRDKSIASVYLDLSGIAFAVQSVFFLFMGSFADYGTFRPWLTIFWTVVSYGAGFGWLGVQSGSKWEAAAALLILGQIAYNISNTYFIAASIGLARDLPVLQTSETDVLEGKKTPKQHVALDIKERNRISNVSYAWLNLGSALFCVVAVGILYALHTDSLTVDNNTHAYSVICAIATAFWVVFALPWQFTEQHRPGQAVPADSTYFTVGIKNAVLAAKELWHLKQAFLYLIAFFIITDTVTTMTTVENVIQNTYIAFAIKELNYFLIAEYAAAGFGILTYWYFQKYFGLTTKTMCLISAGTTIIIGGWGFIGIWSQNFGFKKLWEFWAFAAIDGWMMIPWYQVGFTMIGDVVPVGKAFLFFSLFGIVGKTSAFVGPFITSAIIDRMGGNPNGAFAFLFPSAIVGFVVLWFVDTKKAKVECRRYLEIEAKRMYHKTEEEIREVEAPIDQVIR